MLPVGNIAESVNEAACWTERDPATHPSALVTAAIAGGGYSRPSYYLERKTAMAQARATGRDSVLADDRSGRRGDKNRLSDARGERGF